MWYEHKSIEVLSPSQEPQLHPVAPYYLQSIAPTCAGAQPTALEEAICQELADGWEFCQVDRIETRAPSLYSGVVMSYGALELRYILCFRRANPE